MRFLLIAIIVVFVWSQAQGFDLVVEKSKDPVVDVYITTLPDTVVFGQVTLDYDGSKLAFVNYRIEWTTGLWSSFVNYDPIVEREYGTRSVLMQFVKIPGVVGLTQPGLLLKAFFLPLAPGHSKIHVNGSGLGNPPTHFITSNPSALWSIPTGNLTAKDGFVHIAKTNKTPKALAGDIADPVVGKDWAGIKALYR